MNPFARLTFLARFAIVTFVSAAIAALILASVLEATHRRAVEADQTRDAIAHVEAVFTPLVDRLERGRVPAAELTQAARDADVFSYVTGVRMYGDDGRPIVPAGAPPQRDDVRRAVASDAPLVLDHGATRTAYAQLASTDGARIYVIAIDLSAEQMSAQGARERWVVAGATGGGVLLIFCSLVALAAGASRELERRRRESRATFVDALKVMARMLDLRDPYTAGHSERVAGYACAIARELGLADADVRTIETGALLHDLGKIAVPDAVLFKPGLLDRDERAMIEVHPAVGASIVGSVASMEDVVPCILHHHEKIDGSGYPHGLAGDAIPFLARVIAVADAFDAMTTDRPYRRALSMHDALGRIAAAAGTQFDPRCAAAFAALAARGAIVPPVSRGEATFARRTHLHAAAGTST